MASQCFHEQIPLQQLIDNSTLVVEGEVINQKGTRINGVDIIQTRNTINVSRIFKGSLSSANQVEFVTLGGSIGAEFDHISSGVKIRRGQMGVFALAPDANGLLRIVNRGNGVIRYTQSEYKASRHNEVWNDIQTSLYSDLIAMSGSVMQVVGNLGFDFSATQSNSINNVGGLSPLLISAGSKSVLTINGTNFGSSRGSGGVEFRFADDGGNSRFRPLPNQYVNWSDTQIQVEVPSGAGSGTVNVVNDSGIIFNSTEEINVPFNHTNFIFTDNNGNQFAAFANLYGDNSNNGYDFRYATNIDANQDAELTINDMYDKWRCSTGRNFVKAADLNSGDSANSGNVQNNSDNINVVKFDTGEISGTSGTLAFVLSRGAGCSDGNGGINAYVTEMDFVINSDSNFHFRDTNNQSLDNNEIDFESVVVHELGHAQQLGHVLDSNEVMFFSIGGGVQRRNISADDQMGARFINENATQNSYCGQPSMTYASCDFVYDTGNWSPLSPAGTSNPIATATVVNGTATLNQFVELEDLTIDSGATLNFSSGVELMVNGDVGNNGSISLESLTMNGGSQNITGNGFSVDNFNIDSSSTTSLNSTFTTNGVLRVDGTLNTNDNLILSSDANKTAVVDEVAGTINGNVSVERFYPAQRAFRFVTSSVNTSTSIFENWQNNGQDVDGEGTHITGGSSANGFDQNQSNNPSMFIYDNTGTNGYTAVSSTNAPTDNLTAGTPYLLFIRGDRSPELLTDNNLEYDTTLITSGSLQVGPVNSTNLNPTQDAYSFAGNPLQAPVNMETILTRSGSNLIPTYYYWDPTIGDVGDYVAVNTLSNSNDMPMNSVADRFAQPMQAFFVRTDTNGPASMTFNESDKNIVETNNQTYSEPVNLGHIYGMIYTRSGFNNGGSPLNGFSLRFDDVFNSGYDFFDSPKLKYSTESISTVLNGEDYSIQERERPTNNEVIPLRTENLSRMEYSYVFNLGNLPNLNTYLLDNYTGTYSLLDNDATTSVNFMVDPNDAMSSDRDRFEIRFSDTTLSIDREDLDFRLYPNPSSGAFHIELNNPAFAKAEIYNMLGQSVYSIELNQRKNQINTNLKSGSYILIISKGDSKKSHKLIIE